MRVLTINFLKIKRFALCPTGDSVNSRIRKTILDHDCITGLLRDATFGYRCIDMGAEMQISYDGRIENVVVFRTQGGKKASRRQNRALSYIIAESHGTSKQTPASPACLSDKLI
jgi:hypothetical protein